MIHETLIRLWAATTTALKNRDAERGAGLVEYAMLIGMIVLVCIAAITVLGGATEEPLSELGSQLGS